MIGPDYIELSKVEFTSELLKCLPGTLARKYEALPVGLHGGQLWVALADTSNKSKLAALQRELQREVHFCQADREHLRCLLNHFYGLGEQRF